jgi:excisionase family DNA binding protein
MGDQTTKSIHDLWGYREAAEFLHITPGTLRRRVMERSLPFYRPFGKGSRVLFDPDDLAIFVQASRVEPIEIDAERQGV